MERELVKAVLANEALIALIGCDRAARAGVLDRAEPLLNQQQCRVVRLRSYGDQPLDLQTAMNQVVGQGSGGADRVERFFDAIALPVAQERHIVLLIENAARLTSDLVSYLALIGPTTVGQDLRLQIVLAGDPAMWDTLPRAGNLAVDRIETRIAVEAALPPGKALRLIEREPDREHDPEPPPPVPDFSSRPARVTSDRPPQTYGHEDLRQRLAQRHRRRERIGLFTSRLMAKVLTTVFVLTTIIAAVILWARLPELRAAVRHWAVPALQIVPAGSSTVTALVARGNWLLAKGDVVSARAVFENAAIEGSAAALTGLAKANDPRYLTDIGAHGVTSDAGLAIGLYQRAAAMGDRDATDRLSRLQASLKR